MIPNRSPAALLKAFLVTLDVVLPRSEGACPSRLTPRCWPSSTPAPTTAMVALLDAAPRWPIAAAGEAGP